MKHRYGKRNLPSHEIVGQQPNGEIAEQPGIPVWPPIIRVQSVFHLWLNYFVPAEIVTKTKMKIGRRACH